MNDNVKGMNYYDKLIDRLLEENIEPMITIFHWDTPQVFQDEFGGWIDRKIIPEFVKFANFVFERYSNKVRYWFTLNEPFSYCSTGHELTSVHTRGIT